MSKKSSRNKSQSTTVVGLRLDNRMVEKFKALAAAEGVRLSVYVRRLLA